MKSELHFEESIFTKYTFQKISQGSTSRSILRNLIALLAPAIRTSTPDDAAYSFVSRAKLKHRLRHSLRRLWPVPCQTTPRPPPPPFPLAQPGLSPGLGPGPGCRQGQGRAGAVRSVYVQATGRNRAGAEDGLPNVQARSATKGDAESNVAGVTPYKKWKAL